MGAKTKTRSRIKIEDLPKDLLITETDLKKVMGGRYKIKTGGGVADTDTGACVCWTDPILLAGVIWGGITSVLACGANDFSCSGGSVGAPRG